MDLRKRKCRRGVCGVAPESLSVLMGNGVSRTLQSEVHQFDFVVVCSGMYGDCPNIPEFPPKHGPDVFHGRVMHSMEYSEMDHADAAKLVKGKRVGVVGFQKSGMDISMECSSENGIKHPCTLLYRTEHWNMPDHSPWGVPLEYLYQSRFSELMIHKPGEGTLLLVLATSLSPLRWGISKFVESHIKKKLGMAKHAMVPKHSFLKEVNSCSIATVPEQFFERVEEGSIVLKKAQRFSFCNEGVMVDNNTTYKDGSADTHHRFQNCRQAESYLCLTSLSRFTR